MMVINESPPVVVSWSEGGRKHGAPVSTRSQQATQEPSNETKDEETEVPSHEHESLFPTPHLKNGTAVTVGPKTVQLVRAVIAAHTEQSFAGTIPIACNRIDEKEAPYATAHPREILHVSDASARVLTTEIIYSKYGLTNVLMCVAAMMAYASLDDRMILFPVASPVDLESLLDIDATQRLLKDVNVVFLLRNSTTAHNLPQRMKAKASHWSFGHRIDIGSSDIAVAERAAARIVHFMIVTREVKFVSQRDFFLNWPFRYTAPLDLCFYLRRIVFAESVRSKARRLLRALEEKHKVQRYVAVHLRLERDAKLVSKLAEFVSAEEVRRFFETEILPLAVALNVDAVYVCAGRLGPQHVAALKSFAFPIFIKSDFPELDIRMEEAHQVVTNHFSAAVDLLVLQHAAAAVTMDESTFSLAVMAKRCHSPSQRNRGSWSRFFRNSSLTREAPSNSGSSSGSEAPQRPHDSGGAFSYTLVADPVTGAGRFTPLFFVHCDEQLRSLCYFKGV